MRPSYHRFIVFSSKGADCAIISDISGIKVTQATPSVDYPERRIAGVFSSGVIASQIAYSEIPAENRTSGIANSV